MQVVQSVVNTPGIVLESTGELAIIDIVDDTAPLSSPSFRYSHRGVSIVGDPTLDQFCLELSKLERLGALIHFCIGDLLIEMQKRFGETYAQAAGWAGFSIGTLMNDVSVARAVKPEVRRPDLSYTHHKLVAALPEQYHAAVLEYAAEKGLNSSEMAQYVKKLREELPDPANLPEIPDSWTLPQEEPDEVTIDSEVSVIGTLSFESVSNAYMFKPEQGGVGSIPLGHVKLLIQELTAR